MNLLADSNFNRLNKYFFLKKKSVLNIYTNIYYTMENSKCKVEYFDKLHKDIDLLDSTLRMQIITECKCADHIDQEPYKFLTISEIRSKLYQAVHELNMWCCRNISDDSNEIRDLLSYIVSDVLSAEDNTLLSLLAKVEKAEKNKEAAKDAEKNKGSPKGVEKTKSVEFDA